MSLFALAKYHSLCQSVSSVYMEPRSHLSKSFHPARSLVGNSERSGTPCLLDEPIDLAFCPFLLVKWVHFYFVPAMLDRIIRFSTDDAKGKSATSVLVHDRTSTEGLYSVHNYALNHGKLSITSLAEIFNDVHQRLRLCCKQYLHALSVGISCSSANPIPRSKAPLNIWRGTESARQNHVRLPLSANPTKGHLHSLGVPADVSSQEGGSARQ
jgi:hypothetical protein